MIEVNVIKGVHELLGEHGAKPRPEERFSDFVARALHITEGQAEVFLEALHEGATPEEAIAKAGIDAASANADLLTRVARSIGSSLGELKKRV